MSNRNPFRTLERVGRIVGYSIAVVISTFAFVAVGTAVSNYYGWGWWGLLLIPGVPIAFIVVAILGGLLRLATDTIHDAWRMAKWRWDDRNRDEPEQSA